VALRIYIESFGSLMNPGGPTVAVAEQEIDPCLS